MLRPSPICYGFAFRAQGIELENAETPNPFEAFFVR